MNSFLDLPLYNDSMEDMLDKHNITKLIEFERYARDNALFDKQGFPCNNNLPGDDRLDLVNNLYDETNKWLFEE